MTPTLFSVSYAGLWGQQALDIESFIRKAATLGYRGVELMGKRPHLSVLDVDDAAIERIKACAQKNNIEIATLAGYTDFTAGKTASEVPFVEMQVLYIQRLAQLAQKLGAKIIRVFTGYSTAEEADHDDWQKCVKAQQAAGCLPCRTHPNRARGPFCSRITCFSDTLQA